MKNISNDIKTNKIAKEQFLELKNSFGTYSSFAVWKSIDNVSDISMFDTDKVLNEINNDYIFVALNPANHENNDRGIVAFRNFHSKDPHQKDYKLCYALQNTRFWGSYITDLYKSFIETDSNVLIQKVKNNPLMVESDIKALEKEIEILTKNEKKITLIALSRYVEKQLKKYFKGKYKVAYVTHYSYRYNGCSDIEIYKNRVLKQLQEL